MNRSKPYLEYTLATLLIITIGLQLTISGYLAWPFTTDDAFISWRYAQHLAQGDGLQWNLPGPAVEGYSNFLWVILIALIIKLGLPIAITVKCFASLSLLAALICLYQFSRTFLSPLPATLPVYLFSHYTGVIWWTVSGLETSFFVALVLFVNWQSARAMGFRNLSTNCDHPKLATYAKSLSTDYLCAWILSCLGLTLLALTRFDGIIWSAIIGVFIACNLWHSRINEHSRNLLLIFSVFFIFPYTSYFIWRLYYFGHFLPNSYTCKINFAGNPFQLIINYLPIAFPCLVLGLPYFFTNKDCRHNLLWLPSLLYALLLYGASPNIAYHNRLFLSSFSLLTIMPVLGVQEFFSYFHYKTKNNALASTIVILTFTYFFITDNQLGTMQTAVKHYQQRSTMRQQVAMLLNQDVPKAARVLVADCGVIPFYARNDIQIIDSLCLNNIEMTSKTIHLSLPLYAKRLQEVIKPEWVIDSYYPSVRHGNTLNEQLRKTGFYKNYELVKSYQSHDFFYENGQVSEKNVDFMYFVYKRK